MRSSAHCGHPGPGWSRIRGLTSLPNPGGRERGLEASHGHKCFCLEGRHASRFLGGAPVTTTVHFSATSITGKSLDTLDLSAMVTRAAQPTGRSRRLLLPQTQLRGNENTSVARTLLLPPPFSPFLFSYADAHVSTTIVHALLCLNFLLPPEEEGNFGVDEV